MTLPASPHPVCLAALVAGAVAVAGCEVNINTEGLVVRDTRTFTVRGMPDLSLETFDGGIEVHAWDRSEVEVEIEKRAMDQTLLGQIAVEATQQDDRIAVTVTGPRPSAGRGVNIGVYIAPSARIRVALPRQAVLAARTGDGPIRVEGVEGRLTLTTTDGSVTVERVSGEIVVRADEGAIRVRQAAGALDLETGDGSIGVDGRPTRLAARTGDGAIRVRADEGTEIAGPWTLSSRDGSITLTLPDPFGAEIDAQTGDGSIRSSHPGLVIEGGPGGVRQIRQRLGGGGTVLTLRTGDGSIRIER